MATPNEISDDDFEALCRTLGLKLTAEEADRLRAAFGSMRVLLQRLPREPGFFPEPATIYAHPGARLMP